MDVLPQKGEKVKLGAQYFLASCELIMEVGLKLGQTLWRKVLPNELEIADQHLQSVIYDALQIENWKRAEIFSEFAVQQRKMATDLDKRIALMNLAIALKFGGNPIQATEVLSNTDWSATLAEFRLAKAILSDQFDQAVEIMQKIGVDGDLLTEQAYHSWPLFKKFRNTSEFLATYEEIYGHSFAWKMQTEVKVAKAATTAAIERQEVLAPPESGI